MRLLLVCLALLSLWPGIGPGLGVASAQEVSPPDPEVARRIQFINIEGVSFRFPSSRDDSRRNRAPEELAAPTCAAPAPGLCDINWKSAPAGWKGTVDRGFVLPSQASVLLRTTEGNPLLWSTPAEVGVAIDLHVRKDNETATRILQWPYFNYLLYTAAMQAKGQVPKRFAQWTGNPLLGTHRPDLAVLVAVAISAVLALLFALGKKQTERTTLATKHWLEALSIGRKPDTETANAPDAPSSPWEEVGFAKPLSGFLTLLGSMFVLIGPYFALQSVLAGVVQPFPEADGLWKNTGDTLFIVWLTFDLGTQTAVVKYFAEHRARSPQEALRDFQFYVWWQITARTVEAIILAAVALRAVPYTSYAIYAPFVMLYAVTQLPAIAAVPKLLCQSMQRFDYQNLLDIAETRILSFVAPIPFILIGRSWGLAHPQYGEAFGAAIGMGIGSLFKDACVFSLGLYAVKKMKIPILPVFLPQFDWATAKRQLFFGFKVTLGQEPFRFIAVVESVIIVKWLQDFPAWLGIRDMIHNRLAFLFVFAWSYYQSALPVFSEAHGQGKETLVRYYVGRYLQFGFLFSALIFSLLSAVGPQYVNVALGTQWQKTADFLLLGCISGLFLPLAWLSDSLQQGAGRPGTTTLVMLVEQGVRLLLLVFFVPTMQFAAIYVALNLALCVKCGLGWWLNHRYIVSRPFSGNPLRNMVLLPLLCGVVNYLCLRGMIAVVSPTSWMGMMVLFFVAGAASFAIGFFSLGFLGGLEPQALTELTQAAAMSALVRPICEGIVYLARLGTRLSPWPATDHAATQAAMVQAGELRSEAQKDAKHAHTNE